MKIIKNKDHYLLKNDKGEYHLSLEEFNQLGESEAIKLAESEIGKKVKASYQDTEIDFKRARALGFCEYGIKHFCKELKLDINKTYSLSLLKDKLTLKVFLEYPDECLKLFGKNVFYKFGGAKSLLSKNRTGQVLSLILNHAVEDKVAHKLACEFALRCIDNFEKKHPDDSRPRKAIEAKLKWIDGEIGDAQLASARSAAWSAVRSAAYSAAHSAVRSAAHSAARSAAYSVARSAARSAESAARSAARSAESAAYSAAWSAVRSAESAAYSAAWSAELEWQIERTLKEL